MYEFDSNPSWLQNEKKNQTKYIYIYLALLFQGGYWRQSIVYILWQDIYVIYITEREIYLLALYIK